MTRCWFTGIQTNGLFFTTKSHLQKLSRDMKVKYYWRWRVKEKVRVHFYTFAQFLLWVVIGGVCTTPWISPKIKPIVKNLLQRPALNIKAWLTTLPASLCGDPCPPLPTPRQSFSEAPGRGVLLSGLQGGGGSGRSPYRGSGSEQTRWPCNTHDLALQHPGTDTWHLAPAKSLHMSGKKLV